MVLAHRAAECASFGGEACPYRYGSIVGPSRRHKRGLDAATLERHLLRYGYGPLLDQFAADLTQPRPPVPDPDEQARRQSWRDMLAATRHRAALYQERPTEDDLRRGDGDQVNRWFYRLDRLLNRFGADDAESGDDVSKAAR